MLAGKGACQDPRKDPTQKSQMYITDGNYAQIGGSMPTTIFAEESRSKSEELKK